MDALPFPSRIISGTMTWSRWGKKLSTGEMEELIHRCLEMGITTFDHADIYGDYSTETDFGNAFATSGIDRENVQFISKCGIQLSGGIRKNNVKHYDYSEAYIIASVERSLVNLRTPYLDMLLLHRPSPLMNPVIVASAVKKLMGEGKIKAFGVSNFTPSQIRLIETEVPVTGNQIEFSLAQHSAMWNGILDDCMVHGRTAMAWSPLGDYFKEKNGRNTRISMVLERLMSKYNAGASQLLLAWVLQHPAKIHPVVGTTTPERLKEALAAQNVSMDITDWFLLLEASKGQEVP